MAYPLTLHAPNGAWPGMVHLASVAQRLSSRIPTSSSGGGNIGSGSFLPAVLLVVVIVPVLLIVLVVVVVVVEIVVVSIVVGVVVVVVSGPFVIELPFMIIVSLGLTTFYLSFQ